MKLAHVGVAEDLVVERQMLLDRVKVVEGGRLTIKVNGTFEDPAMVAALTGPLLAELKNRIQAIEGRLERLGVEMA